MSLPGNLQFLGTARITGATGAIARRSSNIGIVAVVRAGAGLYDVEVAGIYTGELCPNAISTQGADRTVQITLTDATHFRVSTRDTAGAAADTDLLITVWAA